MELWASFKGKECSAWEIENNPIKHFLLHIYRHVARCLPNKES